MIKLKLKDGSVREVESGLSAAEIAKGIGMGLYKSACACKINGRLCDLRTTVAEDCDFEILTFENKEGRQTFWHTASHLLAQAVKNLYPNAKLGRGPATENGFYYDFGVEKPFSADDLKKIEDEMKRLAKEGLELERFELSPEEAEKLMGEKGEIYKLELIKKHEGETLSFYKQGDFVDLCAGPHLMSIAPIKAVKLLSCTGAYWGKAEEGKQLSRIYGVAFPKASELEEHLKALEEAKLRDHNKIGRELEYFTTVDYIGQGLPILMPKGAKVIQILQRFVEDEEERRGYLLTKTPFLAKSDLYKISGHWDHYRDGMFVLGDADKAETEEVFALRPMTCPFQFQVYLSRLRSYRELPMRFNETSTLFRNEDSGEMHGLIRVRQFTISEGHIACRPDQVEEEFRQCVELARFMLKTVGLDGDVSYRFSKWDENNKEKYIGSAEEWENVQNLMRNILNHIGIEFTEADGEAAFYGPKLDIQIRNVYGKEDTLITVQIDFQLAKKFGMEYVDADGSKKYPYVIHRTSIGCYERTLALLLEKYAGALPLWLSPVQARILPISDRQQAYAEELLAKLREKGLRCEIDSRNEKIGYKIRSAQVEKIPYMLVIGDKEQEAGEISLRSRKDGDLGSMPAQAVIEKLDKENKDKVN
ncbi:MAG: threonyl-tRNA synthetase [Oscillospiraceae bacterium]|jgi:threonyl-tRNA synthetase|nr:threonyl-tRNA synthetase [Oscillospiraceae bacterium]